jgi:glutaredoxin
MSKRKKIYLSIGVPVIITLFISTMMVLVQKNFNDGFESYIKQSFCGVVEKIYYQKHSRGYPNVVINDQSIYLGVDFIEIRDYIQVGDSICKKSGGNKYSVCRLGKDMNWQCKEYVETKPSIFDWGK